MVGHGQPVPMLEDICLGQNALPREACLNHLEGDRERAFQEKLRELEGD